MMTMNDNGIIDSIRHELDALMEITLPTKDDQKRIKALKRKARMLTDPQFAIRERKRNLTSKRRARMAKKLIISKGGIGIGIIHDNNKRRIDPDPDSLMMMRKELDALRKELDALMEITLPSPHEKKKIIAIKQKARLLTDRQFACPEKEEKSIIKNNKRAQNERKCMYPFMEEVKRRGICLNLDSDTVDKYLKCYKAITTSSNDGMWFLFYFLHFLV